MKLCSHGPLFSPFIYNPGQGINTLNTKFEGDRKLRRDCKYAGGQD